MNPRYALFGYPVAHSLSPRIHAQFAQQLGTAMEYVTIDVAPDIFAQTLQTFAEAGGHGGNVTVPHKQLAFGLCNKFSDRAQRAGSINTLLRMDAGWYGDNTDGSGLIGDLTLRHGCNLDGRRVLMLGAGGAAAGIAPALLGAGVCELIIANRTLPTATVLVARIDDGARVSACAWEALTGLGSVEIIINATSAARSGQSLSVALPSSLVSDATLAIDLGYGTAADDFLSWAKAAGCMQRIDGLGMLVEQAADSFQLWHGTRPQTDVIYEMLRAEQSGEVTLS